MDHTVARIARRELFFLDSTILISMLNAIHYFADYLVGCDMMDNGEKQKKYRKIPKSSILKFIPV